MAADITFESTSRYVKTEAATIHLNDVGEGPPLVLLHELAQNDERRLVHRGASLMTA